MNDSYKNNSEVLRKRLELVVSIYRNTVLQSAALTERDHNRLKSLLDERQKIVDQFAELERAGFPVSSEDDCGDESFNAELERLIRSGIRQTFEQNAANIENANRWLSEISKSIKHVKTGQIALQKGYFKKMPQQYGYFFDKKAGSRSYGTRA